MNRIFAGLFLPVLPVTARTSQRHEFSCSKFDDFFTDRSSHSSQRELNLDADEEEKLKAYQLPHV